VWHVWGENRNAYKILVGAFEEKRPLGRIMPRCDANIKVYPNEIEWRIAD
jgi:hypothetical protein